MSWPIHQALVAALPSLPPERVRSVLRDLDGGDPAGGIRALEAMAPRLKARFERVALTPAELGDRRNHRWLPLVFHHPATGWAALLAAPPGQVLLLADNHGNREGTPVTPTQLADILGVSVDQPLVLAHALPASPLMPEPVKGHSFIQNEALRTMLRPERPAMWTTVVYAAWIGILTLVIPVAVQSLVNTLLFARQVQPLLVVGLMLTAGLAFAAVLHVLQWLVVEYMQRRMFLRLVADLTWRLRNAVRHGAHAPTAELFNRFFEVFFFQKGVASLIVEGSALALQLVAGAILLGAYHPALLMFDLALIVGALGVTYLVGRRAMGTARMESMAKFRMGAWLQDMAEGRPGAVGPMAEDHAEDLARQWLRTREAHASQVLQQIGASMALGVVANGGVLLVGGFLVMQGQLTVGQLVAAELVVSAMAGGLSKLGKYLETYYDIVTAAEKISHMQHLEMVDGDGHGADGHDHGDDHGHGQAEAAHG